MKIDLKTYMEERDRKRDQSLIPGPVITISREHGCEATPIALKIIHKIEEVKGSKAPWRYINKQVLEDAAKELQISTQKIKTAMNPGPEALVDDLLSSFTQHYVATSTILETLEDVLELYARRGNVITVGRGGALIARNIPHSLHIRLQAPPEWRAKRMSARRNVSLEEAAKICEEVDKKRAVWYSQMSHGKTNDVIYDLIINRKTISEDQIIDMIFSLLIKRQIIKVAEEKMTASHIA